MFSGALSSYKTRQAELSKETARATAAAKKAAHDLATETARQQNAGAEEVFHTQQRIGTQLKAVRKAAAAADKEVAALSQAVHQLEQQTLLFGDLEHYLNVIEGEVADVCRALQRIQEGRASAPAR